MKHFIQSSRVKRKVLIVDDEIINRELLRAMLESEYEVHEAENGKEAYDILIEEEAAFSLILLDLVMPVMDGLTLLRRCKAHESLKSIPIIVMTSQTNAELESIRIGAADFIPKPYPMPDVILARCNRIVELNEDRIIISYTEKDKLTGLYSKEYFFEYLSQLPADLLRHMDAVAINLDGFCFVTELYGRREGNALLQKAAGKIADVIVGSQGIACRREPSTFCVFRQHIEDYEARLNIINKQLASDPKAHGVRLRAGICSRADEGVPPEIRFDRAKTACDRLRNNYSRCSEWYSEELHRREMLHKRLIADVNVAIQERHLKVYYQPKYRFEDGKPVLSSAEALIRWQHPTLGFISPGEFIPLFEQNGLINLVDYYVWLTAAQDTRRWRDELGFVLPVSVNVSRADIFDNALEQKLLGVLRDNGLSASDIMLEITESAYSDNADRLLGTVSDLRQKGFKIEMDDFGSGYSSLNMLTDLPIDVLKLDMQFTRNMLRDSKSLRLVELVMDIAHFMDVPVVAEGVETKEQLDMLLKMGCLVFQGYYFSPPVPAPKFEELLKNAFS